MNCLDQNNTTSTSDSYKIMNIYSIKEIIEATNNIFHSKNIKSKKKRIESKPKIKIEKIEKPIILKTEPVIESTNHLNIIDNKTNIKAEAKDHMVNELYLFMKKKIKKNTLKLIIEEQIEIKILKNEIILLKQSKEKLIQNYNILEKDYEIILENYKKLKISKEEVILQNDNLKINNETLKINLNNISQKYEGLSIEHNKLIIDNGELQSNLNLFTNDNENLIKENNELKSSLSKTEQTLQTTIQKNRSFDINNAELKNTISRYIVNSKKLQEQLNSFEKNKNLELNEIDKKVKFYQDENVRLSGELLSFQKKNETIKINLTDIENEKLKISNKINELSKSIEQKTNVVETVFSKESLPLTKDDNEKLNQKEQQSLDEVISRIFKKI